VLAQRAVSNARAAVAFAWSPLGEAADERSSKKVRQAADVKGEQVADLWRCELLRGGYRPGLHTCLGDRGVLVDARVAS